MRHLRSLFAEALSQEQNTYIEKGVIYIRNKPLTPNDVLSTILTGDAYDDLFLEWVQERKEELLGNAQAILSDFKLQDRFDKLKTVYARGAVVPFVGAGMSMPSGYPGWTPFLRDILSETSLDPFEFERLIGAGDYEGAAEALSKALGPAFNEAVENVFGRSREALGCVQLLPHAFGSCVITTNFDDVIKRCYDLESKPFAEEIAGDRSAELPKKLAEGRRVLLKLHGTSTSARGRILTSSEYETHYGADGQLQKAVETLCSKTLLFMGCSLTVDRTLKAMRDYVSANGPDNVARHYAFLPVPASDAARNQRRDELAACNIYPIWYPDGTHDESIEALLFALMER